MERKIPTVQATSRGVGMQATRMLCVPRPPAPHEDYDPCMEKNSQNNFMLPCNLLPDNGCLKCHRVHRETGSKLLKPSGIHCVNHHVTLRLVVLKQI